MDQKYNRIALYKLRQKHPFVAVKVAPWQFSSDFLPDICSQWLDAAFIKKTLDASILSGAEWGDTLEMFPKRASAPDRMARVVQNNQNLAAAELEWLQIVAVHLPSRIFRHYLLLCLIFFLVEGFEDWLDDSGESVQSLLTLTGCTPSEGAFRCVPPLAEPTSSTRMKLCMTKGVQKAEGPHNVGGMEAYESGGWSPPSVLFRAAGHQMVQMCCLFCSSLVSFTYLHTCKNKGQQHVRSRTTAPHTAAALLQL